MNINQKIQFRALAWAYLNWNQYDQLCKLNRLILAPYYNDRLIKQGKHVADSETLKQATTAKTDMNMKTESNF